MKVTITFETDNAAFVDDWASEVHNVLRYAADHITPCGGWLPRDLRDSNGNKIGTVAVSRPAPDLSNILTAEELLAALSTGTEGDINR